MQNAEEQAQVFLLLYWKLGSVPAESLKYLLTIADYSLTRPAGEGLKLCLVKINSVSLCYYHGHCSIMQQNHLEYLISSETLSPGCRIHF